MKIEIGGKQVEVDDDTGCRVKKGGVGVVLTLR